MYGPSNKVAGEAWPTSTSGHGYFSLSEAFAKTDSLFTIMTNVRDYQRTIGQRDQLSFNDIRLMNKVYCSRKYGQG